jgi:hypothetical protein
MVVIIFLLTSILGLRTCKELDEKRKDLKKNGESTWPRLGRVGLKVLGTRPSIAVSTAP